MNPFSSDFYEDQIFKGIIIENEALHGITFQDCTFQDCAFKEATFRACRFLRCVFKGCELSLMQVDHSTFKDSRFEDSKLIGVNWVKASWGRIEFRQHVQALSFHRCVLNYSTFMGLSLEKMAIDHCTAREVDFSEANLSGANCRFSDFTGSRFRNTDLTEADFGGAVNYTIHPQLNTLKKTRFSLPEAMSLLFNLDIEIVEPREEE